VHLFTESLCIFYLSKCTSPNPLGLLAPPPPPLKSSPGKARGQRYGEKWQTYVLGTRPMERNGKRTSWARGHTEAMWYIEILKYKKLYTIVSGRNTGVSARSSSSTILPRKSLGSKGERSYDVLLPSRIRSVGHTQTHNTRIHIIKVMGWVYTLKIRG